MKPSLKQYNYAKQLGFLVTGNWFQSSIRLSVDTYITKKKSTHTFFSFK